MFNAIFNEVSKAGIYILASFFILLAYRTGQKGLGEEQKNETVKEVAKRVTLGTGSILAVAMVIAFVFYGASSCDDNGDCDPGFEVTTEQRAANMAFWSVLFGAPYVVGGIDAYSKAKDRAAKLHHHGE